MQENFIFRRSVKFGV